MGSGTRKERSFQHAENGPIKATRLLRQPNKGEAKIAPGGTSWKNKQRKREKEQDECRVQSQGASWPDQEQVAPSHPDLGARLWLPLGRCPCLILYPSCWIFPPTWRQPQRLPDPGPPPKCCGPTSHLLAVVAAAAHHHTAPSSPWGCKELGEGDGGTPLHPVEGLPSSALPSPGIQGLLTPGTSELGMEWCTSKTAFLPQSSQSSGGSQRNEQATTCVVM